MTSGTPADRIAFLTYTKTASEVAASRAAALGHRLEWCRTVHAACYHSAGLNRGNVFGKEDDKLLARLGYPLVGERSYYGNLTGEFVEGADALLHAVSFARNTGRDLEKVADDMSHEYPRVSRLQVRQFKAAYDDLKQRRGKRDFDDMLDMIIQNPQPLPIDVLIMDETQDFTRLQWSALHILGASAKRVYMAGDDDQSIYAFLGADEYGFLDHPADEERVLEYSHRCPVEIGRYADRVIKKLKRRKDKTVQWQDRPGRVHHCGHITEQDLTDTADAGLSAMYLARHRRDVFRIADELEDRGIPHKCRGDALNCSPFAEGVKTYIRLRSGERVPKADASSMLEALGDHANARALRRNVELRDVGREELEFMMRFEQPWNVKFQTTRTAKKVRALQRLLKRANTLEIIGQEPNINVSTMHASKGEEADVVFIDPGCNKRAFTNAMYNQPSEVRLAYVALTRAKQQVMISAPEKATYLTTLFV